jgi:glycosyltransferase involved in cell wall biosynthesis
MIDPNNIQQIADAIKLLRDDPSKRKALSVGALETAKNLTIEHRAKGILDFISNKIMNDGNCR